jgi:hypothetical protein
MQSPSVHVATHGSSAPRSHDGMGRGLPKEGPILLARDWHAAG